VRVGRDFHVVFTLPDELAQLSIDNPYTVYHTLCRQAGRAIVEVGKRWSALEALMGATVVLHSWGQQLNRHPHVHCLVPGGGLSLEDDRWVSLPPATFLPKRWLMSEFRQGFLKEVQKRYDEGRLLLRDDLAHLTIPAEFRRWMRRLARIIHE
jgi:hypothetical protein